MNYEYYLRLLDPLTPVYEVNFEANTWRVAASKVGGFPDVEPMTDGGKRFRSSRFRRVYVVENQANGIVAFSQNKPVAEVALSLHNTNYERKSCVAPAAPTPSGSLDSVNGSP